MSNLTPLESRYLSRPGEHGREPLYPYAAARHHRSAATRPSPRPPDPHRPTVVELRRWVEADGAAPTPSRKPSRG